MSTQAAASTSGGYSGSSRGLSAAATTAAAAAVPPPPPASSSSAFAAAAVPRGALPPPPPPGLSRMITRKKQLAKRVQPAPPPPAAADGTPLEALTAPLAAHAGSLVALSAHTADTAFWWLDRLGGEAERVVATVAQRRLIGTAVRAVRTSRAPGFLVRFTLPPAAPQQQQPSRSPPHDSGSSSSAAATPSRSGHGHAPAATSSGSGSGVSLGIGGGRHPRHVVPPSATAHTTLPPVPAAGKPRGLDGRPYPKSFHCPSPLAAAKDGGGDGDDDEQAEVPAARTSKSKSFGGLLHPMPLVLSPVGSGIGAAAFGDSLSTGGDGDSLQSSAGPAAAAGAWDGVEAEVALTLPQSCMLPLLRLALAGVYAELLEALKAANYRAAIQLVSRAVVANARPAFLRRVDPAAAAGGGGAAEGGSGGGDGAFPAAYTERALALLRAYRALLHFHADDLGRSREDAEAALAAYPACVDAHVVMLLLDLSGSRGGELAAALETVRRCRAACPAVPARFTTLARFAEVTAAARRQLGVGGVGAPLTLRSLACTHVPPPARQFASPRAAERRQLLLAVMLGDMTVSTAVYAPLPFPGASPGGGGARRVRAMPPPVLLAAPPPPADAAQMMIGAAPMRYDAARALRLAAAHDCDRGAALFTEAVALWLPLFEERPRRGALPPLGRDVCLCCGVALLGAGDADVGRAPLRGRAGSSGSEHSSAAAAAAGGRRRQLHDGSGSHSSHSAAVGSGEPDDGESYCGRACYMRHVASHLLLTRGCREAPANHPNRYVAAAVAQTRRAFRRLEERVRRLSKRYDRLVSRSRSRAAAADVLDRQHQLLTARAALRVVARVAAAVMSLAVPLCNVSVPELAAAEQRRAEGVLRVIAAIEARGGGGGSGRAPRRNGRAPLSAAVPLAWHDPGDLLSAEAFMHELGIPFFADANHEEPPTVWEQLRAAPDVGRTGGSAATLAAAAAAGSGGAAGASAGENGSASASASAAAADASLLASSFLSVTGSDTAELARLLAVPGDCPLSYSERLRVEVRAALLELLLGLHAVARDPLSRVPPVSAQQLRAASAAASPTSPPAATEWPAPPPPRAHGSAALWSCGELLSFLGSLRFIDQLFDFCLTSAAVGSLGGAAGAPCVYVSAHSSLAADLYGVHANAAVDAEFAEQRAACDRRMRRTTTEAERLATPSAGARRSRFYAEHVLEQRWAHIRAERAAAAAAKAEKERAKKAKTNGTNNNNNNNNNNSKSGKSGSVSALDFSFSTSSGSGAAAVSGGGGGGAAAAAAAAAAAPAPDVASASGWSCSSSDAGEEEPEEEEDDGDYGTVTGNVEVRLESVPGEGLRARGVASRPLRASATVILDCGGHRLEMGKR